MTLLSLNGARAASARVMVPEVGIWAAEVDFDERQELAGAAVLVVGGTTLVGTIDPDESGSYLTRSRVRVIGGKLGWRRRIAARHYHNDAGVKVSTIAIGVAAEVGETVAGADERRVGVDFVRTEGPARHVIDRLFPGWWVDFAGVTQLQTREQSELTGAVEILEFNPSKRVATLNVDDLAGVRVGAVLRDRLDVPMLVKSLEFDVAPDKLRAVAWGRAA